MSDRYKINDDIVLDTQTGLEWQVESSGPMFWCDADKYAKSLGNGWRLPTIKELLTLIDYSRTKPATIFPDHENGCFWSSSVYADDINTLWTVDFDNGYIDGYDKSGNVRVRCVRHKPLAHQDSDDTQQIAELKTRAEKAEAKVAKLEKAVSEAWAALALGTEKS